MTFSFVQNASRFVLTEFEPEYTFGAFGVEIGAFGIFEHQTVRNAGDAVILIQAENEGLAAMYASSTVRVYTAVVNSIVADSLGHIEGVALFTNRTTIIIQVRYALGDLMLTGFVRAESVAHHTFGTRAILVIAQTILDWLNACATDKQKSVAALSAPRSFSIVVIATAVIKLTDSNASVHQGQKVPCLTHNTLSEIIDGLTVRLNDLATGRSGKTVEVWQVALHANSLGGVAVSEAAWDVEGGLARHKNGQETDESGFHLY